METPPVSSDAGGVFIFRGRWQHSPPSATGRSRRFAMPISTLLARIRKLIPRRHDARYDEIVRGFGVGELRTPSSPMSDRELSEAIADFLKKAPPSEAVSGQCPEKGPPCESVQRPRQKARSVVKGLAKRPPGCRGEPQSLPRREPM